MCTPEMSPTFGDKVLQRNLTISTKLEKNPSIWSFVIDFLQDVRANNVISLHVLLTFNWNLEPIQDFDFPRCGPLYLSGSQAGSRDLKD